MHFLITAGGTREYIDPVRFLTNASSGKMGYALARAALRAGHKVTLITAPTSLRPPVGASCVRVESAAEMFEAVKRYFARCDCLVMAAAVADYSPARRADTKIKKGRKMLVIRLKPTADILAWAGRHKSKQFVVGFALEDTDVRGRAERKLAEKRLDMIVANKPSAIGKDYSSVQVKLADGPWQRLPKASKSVIARKLISLIEANYPKE